jgi:hypothetical protein
VAPVFPRSASSRRRATQGNPAPPPGIEGVEMRKVYYNLMRKLTISIPLLGLVVLAAMPCAPQQPASLRAAALQSHEAMTISALPWTDPALYKEKFPKKSPFAAGILAVMVAFRNDSDESIKLNLERIRLSVRIDEDNRQQLEPLTPDQVAYETLSPGAKDPTKTRKKFPFPTGAPKSTTPDKNWFEIQKQAENASVPSSVVAPHSTVQGLLYFDLQGQFDLLVTAHLYVPDLLVMEKNRSLTYFEIDLSRPGNN